MQKQLPRDNLFTKNTFGITTGEEWNNVAIVICLPFFYYREYYRDHKFFMD